MDQQRGLVSGGFAFLMVLLGGSFNYAIQHPSIKTVNATKVQITPLCNVSSAFSLNKTENYWIIAVSTVLPAVPFLMETAWQARFTDDIVSTLVDSLQQNQDYLAYHALGQTSSFAITKFANFFTQESTVQFWNQCSSTVCEFQNEIMTLPNLCTASQQSFEQLFEELHENPNLINILCGASACLFVLYFYACAVPRTIKLTTCFIFAVVLILILARQQQTLVVSWFSIFQSFLCGVLIQLCICIFMTSKKKSCESPTTPTPADHGAGREKEVLESVQLRPDSK